MTRPQAGRLKPGATVGILGGGQLGRMLAIAAARLGFRTAIYEPAADCPAAQLANRHVARPWDDQRALEEFARSCDIVTYEFENIPVETAERIAAITPVLPDARALAVSQDRLDEKQFLHETGVATAPFHAVDGLAALEQALGDCDGQGILKTRRFGYDGKGQVRITARNEAGPAWQALAPAACILEGFVDFAMEISVVAARGGDGAFQAFDPACNRHEGGILRSSTLPAPLPEAVQAQARSTARTIMDALDYYGVMGIEFFVTPDHRLLVNEIAPRVHNSGHWTEAACLVSQFEQHIRAVAGLPLGNPARHSDCVLENLIGEDVGRLPELLAAGDALIHLYGKQEVRPGRKMGHFTRLLPVGDRASAGR